MGTKEISPKKEEIENKLESDSVEEEWDYPGDHGDIRAWGVVLGCWIFAATSLGWGITWGSWLIAFQEEFPTVPLSILTTVAGLANFTTTGVSFVSGRMGDTHGYKKMIGIGAIASFFSFIAMGFTNSIVTLFLFQGLFYGLAAGISFPLIIALPSQWFLKKRGLATGLAISGSGVGGMASSLIIRVLVLKLGYSKAYFIYAGINGITWLLTWYFLLADRVRPLAEGETLKKKPWLPKGVWKDGAFYSLLMAVFIAIFGYLTPFYYITAFVQAKVPQYSEGIMVVVPLAVMNAAAGFGRVLAGLLADVIGPVNCLLLSFALGGAIQLIIWVLADSLATIYVFSVLYGLVGPVFLSLLTPASARIFPNAEGLGALTGILLAANAPGQMAGASISGAILSVTNNNYQLLAIFSGLCMFSGGIILLYARLERERRIWAKF